MDAQEWRERGVLKLEAAGVRREDAAIVSGISLEMATPGVLFIIGAGGAGKSSLLAAMAGKADVELVGQVELDGQPLPWPDDVVLVHQHARLQEGGSAASRLMSDFGTAPEQAATWLAAAGIAEPERVLQAETKALPLSLRRLLAIRAMLGKPASLYLVDEPTMDLDDVALGEIRKALAMIATRACAIVVTHNRRDCLELGGHIALIAGGTLQEHAEARRFFEAPATPAGRLYVDTGNCSLPVAPRKQSTADGIWWLVPGLLCGMSRPGVAGEAVQQFRSLVEQGVQLLVCSEERVTAARDAAAQGLQVQHLAIPDMSAPSFSQAVDLCRTAESLIRENRGVAVHCRGGLGRTGTLLASVLIWFGDTAADAITKVRTARPLAIQSDAQFRFLHAFAERIHGWR